MPPPRAACLIYAQLKLAYARLLRKFQQIQEIVQRIIEIKAQIKYGIINISNIAGAEILTAISALAAQAAQNLLGAVSNMAANLLQAILTSILKILLSHPTAIFSLVAVQQERAIVRVRQERRFLRRASSNIRVILFIITRWTKGIGGANYFKQIQRALPYIEAALRLSADIIQELEGEPTTDAEQRNAVFNEGKYNLLRQNIKRAIEETRPRSVIAGKSQVTTIVEENRRERYDALARKINDDFKKRIRELTRWFQTELAKIDNSNQTTGVVLKRQNLQNAYGVKRSVLEARRKEQLAGADARASAQAFVDGSNYVKAAQGLSGQFSYDMQNLIQNLGEFVENIKDAYLSYKASQALCNSIVRSRDLIRKLIGEIIAMLRKVGNEASDMVIRVLESTESLLDVTREDFQAVVNSYTSAEEKVGPIEMSTTLVRGHGMLLSGDALLKSTINDALVDLINADDVLEDADGSFSRWIADMEKIPDWDGKEGVWAVSLLQSATAPYLGMIAKATRLLRKAPRLAISNRPRDQEQMSKLVRELNNSFRTVGSHNSYVYGVLTSYTAPMSSEAGNLRRILASAGLMNAFALSMSLVALVADITAMVVNYDLDDVLPTYKNCKGAYPEDFTEADLALSSVMDRYNFPEPLYNLNFQSRMETGNSAAENIAYLRERLAGTNYDSGVTDDDVRNSSEEAVA